MTIMEIVSIPVITIICYLLGDFFKLVVLKRKKIQVYSCNCWGHRRGTWTYYLFC